MTRPQEILEGSPTGKAGERKAVLWTARRPERGRPFDLVIRTIYGEEESRQRRYVDEVLTAAHGQGTRPFVVRFRISPLR